MLYVSVCEYNLMKLAQYNSSILLAYISFQYLPKSMIITRVQVNSNGPQILELIFIPALLVSAFPRASHAGRSSGGDVLWTWLKSGVYTGRRSGEHTDPRRTRR